MGQDRLTVSQQHQRYKKEAVVQMHTFKAGLRLATSACPTVTVNINCQLARI